tara:strand:+ start:156 stop:1136 length:981 start_codon:yes stop_codon:yes gene_type:complete
MSLSFVDEYKRAIACYSEQDFTTFFDMAGIVEPSMRMIGKDMLGIAGAHYFTQLDQLAAANTRGETLKHLKRAQKASRDLADSLKHVMVDRAASTALMDAGVALGRDMKTDPAANQDTLSIMSAIFPIDVDGKGFREEGLQKTLIALADNLGSIEADAIPKARRGRGHGLAPWLEVMCFHWIEARKELPTIGHYYRETGDYASISLAALTFAAEKIDREISSSALAEGLPDALNALSENPLSPFVLISFAIPQIVASNAAQSDHTTLANWLGAPTEILEQLGLEGSLEPDAKRETATISKDEFFEMLNSSESGKMLLQAFIALHAN